MEKKRSIEEALDGSVGHLVEREFEFPVHAALISKMGNMWYQRCEAPSKLDLRRGGAGYMWHEVTKNARFGGHDDVVLLVPVWLMFVGKCGKSEHAVLRDFSRGLEWIPIDPRRGLRVAPEETE